MTHQRGNARPHLARRLKHVRREDLLEAIDRGEVTTFAAAVEAGIRTRKRPLEVDTAAAKRRAFRRHPDRVRKDAEMWYGAADNASAFATVEEAKQYWIENRARLMPILARDGRRPWGWWCYDDEATDLRYPGRDLERSTLYAAGLLDAEEEAELLADWRSEFDRTHDPNFFICEGPGKIIRGEVARAAHLVWADIPPALVEKWNAEHVARDQTTAAAVRCVS
jgi:hypothetical protein